MNQGSSKYPEKVVKRGGPTITKAGEASKWLGMGGEI